MKKAPTSITKEHQMFVCTHTLQCQPEQMFLPPLASPGPSVPLWPSHIRVMSRPSDCPTGCTAAALHSLKS